MQYLTRNKKMTVPQSRDGSALLLAVLIVAAVLVVAISVANLVSGEIVLSRSADDSLRAFYAANAGAERALFECRKNNFSGNLSSAPWARATLVSGRAGYALTGSCDGTNRATIQSTGIFPVGAGGDATRRAIEATY